MPPPLPRCPTICEDTNTGAIVRCARWEGHPSHDHYSYEYVIRRMCEYIAACAGVDSDDDVTITEKLVIMKQARTWYDRVVTE